MVGNNSLANSYLLTIYRRKFTAHRINHSITKVESSTKKVENDSEEYE